MQKERRVMRMESNKKKINKGSLGFRLFRGYVHLFNRFMFFRRIHVVGADHLPTDGQPLLVACNHQNTMIDPLQVIFALRPRRACIFARASVFSNKWAGQFLRWIGALPAYRMRTDGENALPHNKDSFAEAGDRMMKGEAVVIFPESYHQDKHHLGDFSLGYLRMAFETAERFHFEQDISILPMAHHYSSYFGARYEVQLSIGTPIPLSPYYEAYKAKPRTTQRNVNALVREQIEQMMVDVHDEPHYLAIDYIRRSYADTYARQHGLNPDRYADRTRAEQQLIVLLENAYRNDENGTRKTYQLAEDIRQKENINRLDDKDFEQCTGLLPTLMKSSGLIITFPLFIFSLWPNVPIYLIYHQLQKKAPDMFKSSLLYGTCVLIGIPLFYPLSTLLCTFLFHSVWISFVYLLIQPILSILAWEYTKSVKHAINSWHYCRCAIAEKTKIKKWREELRSQIARMEQ